MESNDLNHRKIRSFSDIRALCNRNDTVVTLCGGGLDSAHLLAQLAKLDVHLVALSVECRRRLRYRKILRLSEKVWCRYYATRLQERVRRGVRVPVDSCGGKYLGQHPISASLSRPLIARVGVEFARSVGAKILLHTANQSQNSLRRLDGAISDLGFEGYFGTPYEVDGLSRGGKLLQLQEEFGIAEFANRMVSTDTNLWCRELEVELSTIPRNSKSMKICINGLSHPRRRQAS